MAEVGPEETDNAIVVVSGTHGVEGYLGSALQRHHLETYDRDRTGGPVLVFVHALNPYGFSWVRRVNEDNVDLNRNFIDWERPAPANDDYHDLALAGPALVERSRSGDVVRDVDATARSPRTRASPADHLGRPVRPSNGRLLRRHRAHLVEPMDERVHRASPVWHAASGDPRPAPGLGPWGHGELISSAAPGDPALDRQRAWWDDVTSLHDGTSVSAELAGEWLGAVTDLRPDTEVTGVAIEYGTVDPITVLQGLRADAVLHASGAPSAPEAKTIRDQVRAAFIDDDPAWLEACWARYLPVVTTAVERLT
ncbi:MAG: DUF2817 domain-containing protein [Acidimicrobiales bacterium]